LNFAELNLLVQQKLLSTQEAGEIKLQALKQQQSSFSYLLTEKIFDADTVAQFIAESLGFDYLDLDMLSDQEFCLASLAESLIIKEQLLVQKSQEGYVILLADPCRPALLTALDFYLSKIKRYKIVSADKLTKRINALYPTQAREKIDENTSIVHYVETLLEDAIHRRASDIHLEPYAEQLRIRFRIDGLLYLVAELNKTLAARISAHLKVLAELDITERRLPQDGRLQIKLAQGNTVDCRLSSCPGLQGEKLVLRLLNRSDLPLEVDALGFSTAQKELYLKALAKPQGMIIVTGPTGSGKTLTLYTALALLNQEERNIASVEDPVEIELKGVNQVPVNPKIGLNFATVLRTFLRQDPDVLMVGEIRDAETAEIALTAAQTGHLVLSTLHTNSAVESLGRLLNMGLPAYHLTAALDLIIAQRLLRCLCSYCKQPEPEFTHPQIKLSYRAAGCERCQQGYCGRTAIYEVLEFNTALKEKFLANASLNSIGMLAKKKGMQSLYQHGLSKVAQGITSLAELRRVTKHYYE